ncbi:hypothetical protein [Spiroplasma endosymbiont of Cleonymus obscurus]|uniref:hypothetical protein n=1 Tax=Spiroplasma endosymbiont of Cleonymus obscurus TaxID=3066324 RepID=UPI0037DD1657
MDKEKLIDYLDNQFLELFNDDIKNETKINIITWKMKLIMKLQEKIKNGEFN